MFKPHMGICICHNEKRLIVVKKGYCAEGNYEQKQNRKIVRGICTEEQSEYNAPEQWTRREVDKKAKPSPPKARKPIFKPKKGTGEAEVFAEIAEEREWKCFVSGNSLVQLTATQFMHVLPKALNKYPLFKLYKKNIQLASDEVHYAWDFKPRSELRKDPRFDKLFALEEELKQEYKQLKN